MDAKVDKIKHMTIKGKIVNTINTGEHTTGFKVVVHYINNTNEDLMVLHRNNLPIRLVKDVGQYSGIGELTIRTMYYFSGNNIIVQTINDIAGYTSMFKIQNDDLETIRTALIAAYDKDKTIYNISVGIDKVIPIKTIKHEAALYLPDEDILVCTNSEVAKYPHPFSAEGLALSKLTTFVKDNRVSGVFMELVDNENTAPCRFAYMAKQIVEIPAHINGNKKSGVYFTSAENDKLDEVHLINKYYTLEEAEEVLGLYRTREEALTGGNPELLFRADETKNKAELTELKHKLDTSKMEKEALLNSSKHKVAELELDIERNKLENKKLQDQIEAAKVERNDYFDERKLTRADYYDHRSYDRKDESEYLKTAATILITGLGVFAAMRKYG